MALSTMVDSNVMSYPMLVFMKEQGAVVGRGGACPQTSGEAEPALGRRARRSLALGVQAWRSLPSVLQARSVAMFLPVREHQRLMVISSTSSGTPVLGP